MVLLAIALTVLVMVVTGLALFRWLAIRLLAGRWSEVPETDLLLMGVLPGLALVGTLATYLSLLHLLRFGFVVFLTVATLYVLRRHVYAILVDIHVHVGGLLMQARRGNFFPAIAVAGGCAAFAVGLSLCLIPSANVDVWVFHIPLAQSLIAHHGLAFPQLNGMPFYSNQPIFFELLFATAMLAVPHFAAAGAVNLVILFGFVLLLLSFARRARDIQFLILCYIFFLWQNFPLGAAEPMIDLPRSCFSAAAYLFAYRYARNFRCFDLVMSALLAGAAVAGKYTELVTPALVCLTLLPLMVNNRHTWFHIVPAAIIFIAVAGVWYLKNAILLGNPIYPFLFGHPGISDSWMSVYMRDMTRAFSVADQAYSTDLRTPRGWHDFAVVLYGYFQALLPFVLVAALGLTLPLPRRWILPLWTFVLFIFWYAVMFNGARWAVTAILMLLAAGIIVWFSVADRIVEAWNPQWPTSVLESLVRWLRKLSDPWTAMASFVLVALVLFGLVRFKEGDRDSLLPSWMSRDLAVAVVKPGGMDRYLRENKPGYAVYRYIGEHNLAHVLQPFDNGATSYASAYNGGHANDWIVPYDVLPNGVAQTDAFIARNGIHYFIDQALSDATQIERLGGPGRVALARAVIVRLKPHSRLIFADGQGMFLYQILPENLRQ